MNQDYPVLGIDVGSLYIKLVHFEDYYKIGTTVYTLHLGHPIRTLKEILPKPLNEMDIRLGLTGALCPPIAEQLGAQPIDHVRAVIESVKSTAPGVKNIIDIGGGSVTLIRLNLNGEFEGITQNSLCAAGTGSFLDEQATRLGVSYDDIEYFPKVDTPPHIATRCAVFAKSDLIHHQQSGRSKVECWAGLCRSMVSTLLYTLLKGRPLDGLTVVVGGVTQNQEIMRRLKELYGDEITTFPKAHFAGAIGAARLSNFLVTPKLICKLDENKTLGKSRSLTTRLPLILNKSIYPSFEVEESYRDEYLNEVRVTHLHKGSEIPCYMGIDIGSTSTKLILTDLSGEVLCDIYRNTAGDPIGATRKLFQALLYLAANRGTCFDIRGCATTGSGRKMVGLVVGADAIINEITCHVKGAMHVDSTIDTIFEIGGQDSKYMRTKNGKIQDATMNYVCAAGTGSFVEEVGRKLGYDVGAIGDAVVGIAPPHTSDRCTVFMEQDIRRLLRAGYSKDESLAAVLYSVVQNYLNKVVARRYYSDEKIFFQGATARNPGLVAAFENLLGVKMVVSPYAHVMGAWGAALLIKEIIEKGGKNTRFRGLDLTSRKIELKNERCNQCINKCEITFAEIEGVYEKPSWGYMCGREPGKKKRDIKEFRLFNTREKLLNSIGRVNLPKNAPKIFIPRALTIYTFLPLWMKFFGKLGYKVVLSPTTNTEIRNLTNAIAGGEFCFPVKIALGHALWAFEQAGADYIFIPHTISNKPNNYTTNSYFCPYVQVYPSLVRTSHKLYGLTTTNLLSPILDLRWNQKKQVNELYEKVGTKLGISLKEIETAWKAALKSQKEFEQACISEGERALKEIESEKKPVIVVMGRSYNTCDMGINLGLVRKIAEQGHTVIPLDFITYNPSELGEEFKNVYWDYPQRIINSIKKIRTNSTIYPVYFTNFNCGPDSFVETYCEFLAEEKPLLILGLDEHDADTGYITRIEAFLDVVKNAEPVNSFPEIIFPASDKDNFKRRTVWIPNMHQIGAVFGAASFRNCGYDAKVLPLETDESFEVGRQLTSGNECLPTVVTIGALISKLREINANPSEHAFFMGTTNGPCRFGQYALKHRLILNELGYGDILIMQPSAENSYQGIPEVLRKRIWKLFVASDILFKLRLKVAPYELNSGETIRVLDEEVERLTKVIESGNNFEKEWVKSLESIRNIPQKDGPKKPLVGIVGEIYVRCNAFTNDRVIEAIERYGGEAWLAPLSEWFLYTAYLQKWRLKKDMWRFLYHGKDLIKNRYIQAVEHDMYHKAARWVSDRVEPDIAEILDRSQKYLPINFEGEAILTVGRTIKFIEEGVSLIVNCAPFGCMPGTITSSLFQEIQNQTGVPIVNMFYDGEGDLNSLLGVYLEQL